MTISSFCEPAGNIMSGNMHCDACGIKPVTIRHYPLGMMLQHMSTVTEREYMLRPPCASTLLLWLHKTHRTAKLTCVCCWQLADL